MRRLASFPGLVFFNLLFFQATLAFLPRFSHACTPPLLSRTKAVVFPPSSLAELSFLFRLPTLSYSGRVVSLPFFPHRGHCFSCVRFFPLSLEVSQSVVGLYALSGFIGGEAALRLSGNSLPFDEHQVSFSLSFGYQPPVDPSLL